MLFLGHPIFESELNVKDIYDCETKKSGVYLRGAMLEYYKQAPYQVRDVTGFNAVGTNYIQVKNWVDNIAGMASLDNTDDIFFIGVLNMQFEELDEINVLLGVNQFLINSVSTETYFDMLQRRTMFDLFSGDPYYEIDSVLGIVRISAGMAGTMTTTLGFGFLIPDFIPETHLGLVSKMVALKFCEAVLAERTTGNIGGDVRLESDYINTRITDLREEVNKALNDIQPTIFMWG